MSPSSLTGADVPADAGHVPGRPPAQLAADMACLTRVIKAPTIEATWAQLAVIACEQGWRYEEHLAAVPARHVADREANGTAMRTVGAHFPQVKTLEDWDAEQQPSMRRDVLAHLATGVSIARADNLVLLGPPGFGKTHLAMPAVETSAGLAETPCRAPLGRSGTQVAL